ncbi:MAG: hypothetical protein J4431_00845 [Candidatus Aenigmarchaeota archaeon]|nr:hypothetical protein [Candidatus Aenigmarchaeota archaeon]
MIDMDGTFIKTHTFQKALEMAYANQGDNIYNELIYRSKQTRAYTQDNIRMLKGLEALVNAKFTKNMEMKVAKISELYLNYDLLKSLKKIKGKEIIITTKSSDLIAKYLSKKYGLSGGYGSIMKYGRKGKIVGAERLITDKEHKFNKLFVTKLSLAKFHMTKKDKRFDPKKTVIISNDILDIETMKNVGLSIIVKENSYDLIGRLSYNLKLFDIMIDNKYTQIENI